MTEDEARTKWCPYAINASADLALGDMGWDKEISKIHPAFRCIASDCMMFRWYFKDRDTHPHEKSDIDGYCGLAGK